MTRTERIEKMKARMEAIQKAIDELTYMPACPICGSELRKSPKSDRYFCTQQHGHCGVLVLNNHDEKNKAAKYKAYFSTTSMIMEDKNIKIDTIVHDEPFQVFYFAHGQNVTKDVYYAV